MAFTIKTNPSVEIDGVAYIPQITTEARMRLGDLSFTTEEGTNTAYDVIASCFGDKKEEVRGLLPKIPPLEIQMLRAYLLGGEKAVDLISQELARSMTNGE